MERKLLSSVKFYYPRYDLKEIIKRVKEGVLNLKEIVKIKKIVLFGSYAKGNFTGRSDVDLLVIYKGRKRKDIYKVLKKNIQIFNLQIHSFNEK
ncbi:MAG: nucleotidyltransferase domain-containing protein, partial [Candidatus Ratteibacteria bacterium]